MASSLATDSLDPTAARHRRLTAVFCVLSALVLALLAHGSAALAQRPQIQIPPGLDPENAMLIEMTNGPVIIELYPKRAPKHVERIKTLTRAGFYNGQVFHRVIEGFMAQTGDPTKVGRPPAPLPSLKAEFNSMPHTRGVVSMARAGDPDSATTQFFIMFAGAPHLDGEYTAFGKVVVGMETVDQIATGQPPVMPDRMMQVAILSDVFKAMGIDPSEMAPPPPIPDDLDIVSPVLIDPAVLTRAPEEPASEGEGVGTDGSTTDGMTSEDPAADGRGSAASASSVGTP